MTTAARGKHERKQALARERDRRKREREERLVAKRVAREARERARAQKAADKAERQRRRDQRMQEREAKRAAREQRKDARDRARRFVAEYVPRPQAEPRPTFADPDCACGHTERVHGMIRRACMVDGCRCERYNP